ncbi:MAG: FimB/Mfa2 family fimbrial subunit [Muribaculaceae bacterium]|nr:FimB/Mfa2 family fimbrial subunit [Muribaculaceae bacterium]
MKLKNFILSALSGTILCSCSAVYETGDLCPQGAKVNLTFCNNMQEKDLYPAEVHCAKLLLYNGEGNFCGEYEYDKGNTINIDLPVGSYHAIAYGGMSCEDADVAFVNPISAPHSYSELQTYLKDTRADRISRNLHPHFHGAADFTVSLEDMDYTPVAIDLTKNTNAIRVVLKYADGTEIDPGNFNFTVAADNAVSDHANAIVKQGRDVIYTPYLTGSESAEGKSPSRNGEDGQSAWADISVARLTADSKAQLKVTPKGSTEPSVDIELISYIEKIKNLDTGTGSLQDYLDRQDSWVLEFNLEPETDRFSGLTFKINNWEMVINSFDL